MDSTDTFAATPPIASEKALIDRDLPCVRCGYNLRTISTAGICPECSCPVTTTLNDSLYAADHRWLRRMRTGTATMFVADLCLMGFFCIYFSATLFFGALPHAGIALLVLGPAGLAFWVFGAWRITTRQPGFSRRNILWWITRLAAISGVPLALLLALLASMPFAYAWLVRMLAVWFYLLVYLGPMLVCLYCRPLGRRGQQNWLSRLNLALAILYAVGLAAIIALLVLEFAFGIHLVYGSTWVVVASPFLLLLLTNMAALVSLAGHWRLFSRLIRLQCPCESARPLGRVT